MTDTTGASDQSLAPPDAVPDMQPTNEAEARAAAPGGWFTCTVDRAGPAGNHIAIHLREHSGKFNAYYAAAQSMQREMLATALVALTSNKTVIVYLTTTAANGVITFLYATA